MFKKTLLALALTGLAGAATAATIAEPGTEYSAEGIAKLTSFDLADVVATVTTTASYQAGDKVVFTFPNDTFAVGTAATLTVATTGGDPALEADATSVKYTNGNTVTFTLQATAGADAITKASGATFTLGGDLKLAVNNLQAGGKVTSTFNAISTVTSGSFDATTTAAVLAKPVEQYKVSVASAGLLDGVVDVSKGRLVFEDTTTGTKPTDKLTITVTDNAATTESDATAVSVSHKINGNFSFLDADSNGELSSAEKAAVTVSSLGGSVSGQGVAFADDFQSITITDVAEGATPAFSGSVAVDFVIDGETVIPTQTFTVDSVITYKANGDTANSTKSVSNNAGQWKLNSYSDTEVTFVPFSSNYAHAITVTNKGAVEGDISVEITANGITKSKSLGVVAKAKAVTNVGTEVVDYAKELGLTTANAAIKLIVDAPATAIKTDVVYFSKADKDRVKTK